MRLLLAMNDHIPMDYMGMGFSTIELEWCPFMQLFEQVSEMTPFEIWDHNNTRVGAKKSKQITLMGDGAKPQIN